MRNPSLAGLTALALTGGSLLSFATPAQAAEETVLYVRQTSTACSDTGPGTLAQPYCSITPAVARVTAGQTVDIGKGTYPERLTVDSSGSSDQPITIRNSGGAVLNGGTAGVVVIDQHDILLQDLWVSRAVDAPALELKNVSRITIEGGSYAMADAATLPAVRLTGVTQSTLAGFKAIGVAAMSGVSLDTATTGVDVRSAIVGSSATFDNLDRVGIRIDGPGNTVRNSTIGGFTGAEIALGPAAVGTVVANNELNGGAGTGIHNRGAARTAITNNRIQSSCRDGVRIDGASTGVSVQNNVLASNGLFGQPYCDPSAEPGAEIGVYGAARGDTVVDYNNTYHFGSPSGSAYSWDGSRMGLEAFRAVSGQAAHDLDTPSPFDKEDSANSAAPGFPATDRNGNTRADNPSVPNTGGGPMPWADRGPTERLGSPSAQMEAGLDLGTRTVRVDASASLPGYVPITEYVIDFGDGTVVTQDKPIATHTYARNGTYTVSVRVSGIDGRTATVTRSVSLLPRTGTVGLLSLSNLRYASSTVAGWSVRADQAALDAGGQFDLADAGNGQVALLSRATNRYLSVDGTVRPVNAAVGPTETFSLVQNPDGTVSLRWTGGGYVGVSSSTDLTAVATTVGTREKFYRVNVADANRSFKAGANGRYVTAENAGANPLIANRTSVGPWERFDLVDLGSGQLGVFAHANNRFVCADNGGVNPLIANRLSAGAWEKFTLVRNTDGTVSLKAAVNSRYVTADSGGAKPLIANRTAIGPWEKFTLGS
ncbi:PKD domain-containing protein [Micromonospora sp. A3M-1-15]|uniref:PKD domain-containing protein n=1 Tax=Micromonospora sp. A3M-1-15 TaxID=2962035 RepID=UPI0020B7453B|nr:PKD domain-containing protein [Micromonospora sp. A3M-1-15]MCP3787450.1 PKD domain-containing protein [Micromonospora sp. A3M-1-15]